MAEMAAGPPAAILLPGICLIDEAKVNSIAQSHACDA